MNTKRISNISEAKVLAKFSEQGWAVLIPWGDVESYDLVIDRGKGFESVQVKTGRRYKEKDVITFNAYSFSGRTSNQIKTDYYGKADLFAIYFAELDTVYLIPVHECPSNNPFLRLSEPLNGQLKNIRMASDYLLV